VRRPHEVQPVEGAREFELALLAGEGQRDAGVSPFHAQERVLLEMQFFSHLKKAIFLKEELLLVSRWLKKVVLGQKVLVLTGVDWC